MRTLTPRQAEVLAAVARCATYREAGVELGISVRCVRARLLTIRERLGVENVAQAIYVATRDGLLP